MTSEEIFQKLKGATCEPDDDRVAELVQEALDIGIPPWRSLLRPLSPVLDVPGIDAAAAAVKKYSGYRWSEFAICELSSSVFPHNQ